MSTPTQKQALEEAQTKITELEGKVSAAEGLQTKLDEATKNLSAAEKARDDEKARADKAEGDLRASEEKLTKAGTDLQAATERATKAEGERDTEKKRADKAEADLKNADQRHQEGSAARGIKPPKKDASSIAPTGDAKPTPAQLHEQYEAIEDKEERYEFFQKHRSALMAHAAR